MQLYFLGVRSELAGADKGSDAFRHQLDSIIQKLKGDGKLPVLLDMSKPRALREMAEEISTVGSGVARWVSEENQMLNAARHRDASPIFIGKPRQNLAIWNPTAKSTVDDNDARTARHAQMEDFFVETFSNYLQSQDRQETIQSSTFEIGLPNCVWKRRPMPQRLQRTLQPEQIQTWRQIAREQRLRTSARASELERLLRLLAEIEGGDKIDSGSIASRAKLLSESCRSPAQVRLVAARTAYMDKPRLAIKVHSPREYLTAWFKWRISPSTEEQPGPFWKILDHTMARSEGYTEFYKHRIQLAFSHDACWEDGRLAFMDYFALESKLAHRVNMAVLAASASHQAMGVEKVLVVAKQTEVEALRDAITHAIEYHAADLASHKTRALPWQRMLNSALCETNLVACDDDGYLIDTQGSIPTTAGPVVDWTAMGAGEPRGLTALDVSLKGYGVSSPQCVHVSEILLNHCGRFTTTEIRRRNRSRYGTDHRAAQFINDFALPGWYMPRGPPATIPSKPSPRALPGGKEGRRSQAKPFRQSTLSAAGRNQPCPCGSGRKYKRCCLVDNK